MSVEEIEVADRFTCVRVNYTYLSPSSEFIWPTWGE